MGLCEDQLLRSRKAAQFANPGHLRSRNLYRKTGSEHAATCGRDGINLD